MKTIILLIALLLSSSRFFSQVILTSSNNPSAGNIQMIADCDTTGVTQGNAGPNQTWNFTSLVRMDSSQLSWVNASSTPFTSQFASSNVASTNDNSNYNYFTTSSTNVLTNGTGGPGAVIPYSNPELFMQWPFTYNSSFSDNFAANYLSGGIPTVRTGTINVTGDAWGTINLPSGSFSNALRVKYVIVTKDSSNPGTPLVLTTNLTSYVWFTPGKKYPVFEIVYTSVLFNGVPFASMKNVNYTTGNVPIGIQQISTEIPVDFRLQQNYPNPFNPSTKIRFSLPDPSQGGASNVHLKIYDNLGREVASLVNEELKPGTYEVTWDASNYPSGAYYYMLKIGDYNETKKMILLK